MQFRAGAETFDFIMCARRSCALQLEEGRGEGSVVGGGRLSVLLARWYMQRELAGAHFVQTHAGV